MNHAPSAQAMSAHALPPGYNPNTNAIREPGAAAALQAAQQTAQRTGNRAAEADVQAAFLHQYIGEIKERAGVPNRAADVAYILESMDPTRAADLGLM